MRGTGTVSQVRCIIIVAVVVYVLERTRGKKQNKSLIQGLQLKSNRTLASAFLYALFYFKRV